MKTFITGLLLICSMSSFASSEQQINCTEMEVSSEFLQEEIHKITKTCRMACTTDYKVEAIDSLRVAKEIVDYKIEEECQ